MDEPREDHLMPLPRSNGDQSPHSENAKRERVKRTVARPEQLEQGNMWKPRDKTLTR